ncbi:MAG TPA: CopD family protein, partial [Thermomicrobiales bacterium]|nr:CopD family protein [Thermomicrobiales bacterium]
TLTDGTLLDRVVNTLGQTRYGHLWLARFGLIVGLGLVLSACGWWFTTRRQVEAVIAWVLSIAVTVPFALISHASAQPTGRTVAMAADAVHLYATSVWAGGLAMLLFVLYPGLRRMTAGTRSDVVAGLIPRFSTLALIAIAAISLTGFYAGWLQVGNLAALTDTAYGKALLAKLILFAIILVLAAINLLVIDRRMRNRHVVPVWTRRLRWTIAGELVLVVLLLLAVGQMTSLQPARDVMVERSRQVTIEVETDPATTLLLAPGIAGVNHFRLEVSGPALPTDVEALLRLTIPANDDLGTREIQLSRVSGNAFEHHGNEIGIAADWEITVILREPGKAPVQGLTMVAIGTTSPDVDVPGQPWRFQTLGGLTGLALILGGFAALVVALRAQHDRTRKESAGLGGAAILVGVILLVQARIDPVLANIAGERAIDPTDVAMVERGEDIYVAQCLACHGVELRGDGPASAGMDPPPADFSAPHTMAHGAGDLVYWVRNGKQGTAMPGFGNTLSDQGIRDVLSYIAAEQDAMSESGVTTADPATCTVDPLAMDDLAVLAGTGAIAPEVTIDATGEGVEDAVAGDIELTVRQLLACTNGMDTWRRLALFTDEALAVTFADGVPAGFAESAATGAPLPMDQWLALIDIRDVSRLDDGRVVATIEISDPSGQFQLPGAATSSGTIEARVIFAGQDGAWLIDGVVTP